jgi:hypothetical protein
MDVNRRVEEGDDWGMHSGVKAKPAGGKVTKPNEKPSASPQKFRDFLFFNFLPHTFLLFCNAERPIQSTKQPTKIHFQWAPSINLPHLNCLPAGIGLNMNKYFEIYRNDQM